MMERNFSQKTVPELVGYLEGRGTDEEYNAVRMLKDTLGSKFPEAMLEFYKTSRKRGARASSVFYSFEFAKVNNAAKELGLAALKDKSKIVRYRACQLLAYSQDKSLIKSMLELKLSIYKDTLPDLEAAIDAIQNQNQNFFKDRNHSGKIFIDLA